MQCTGNRPHGENKTCDSHANPATHIQNATFTCGLHAFPLDMHVRTSDCSSLCCHSSTSLCSLFLHLLVALVKVKHLDEGLGVDLVHSISWGSASLLVQEVTLDKHTVLAHATDPHITIVFLLQDHSCTHNPVSHTHTCMDCMCLACALQVTTINSLHLLEVCRTLTFPNVQSCSIAGLSTVHIGQSS